MPAKTQALDNAILSAVLRQVAYTSPVGVYVGLFTVAPTPSTSGTEVNGASYARVAATFGAPAAGVTSNSGVLTFPTALELWGTVVAVGIFDQVSGGNLLYFGNLGTSKLIDVGDTASFQAGALSVTEQ